MNILDIYLTTGRYINSFLRGVKDLHFYAERRRELVDDPQAIGYLATFLGYTAGSANLVGKYGPEGFLILTIPAITNLISYYKQRAPEWRLRRLERDWERMEIEGERRIWTEEWKKKWKIEVREKGDSSKSN